MKYKYSEEILIKVCKESYNYRQCLQKLGISPAGGNYFTLKKRIKQLNIDISHFTFNNNTKGKKFGPKRKIEEYLSNSRFISTYKLKKRLISEKIFDYKCYNCLRITWLGEPIPLELHHVNGDSSDNSLNNLTLLCPNCHSQTDNYRGKNKKVSQVGLEPTIP